MLFVPDFAFPNREHLHLSYNRQSEPAVQLDATFENPPVGLYALCVEDVCSVTLPCRTAHSRVSGAEPRVLLTISFTTSP